MINKWFKPDVLTAEARELYELALKKPHVLALLRGRTAQNKVAKMLNVTQNTIFNLERGRFNLVIGRELRVLLEFYALL